MRPAMRRGTAMRRLLNCAWVLLLVSGLAHAAVPNTPTNFVATVVSGWQINLSWTSNETGFEIQRKTGASGTYAQIVFLWNTTSRSYSDAFLASGTTYFYRIRAANKCCYSAWSNEVSATTLV